MIPKFMDATMSKFNQIFAFIAVVEANSFAKAARNLNISTPAVSKQVTALEKGLGVELLHRTTRRLELTDAGRLYFDHCKKLLIEVEEAERLISAIRSEPIGTLNVISGRYFAERYIFPLLKEFVQKYPQVELNIELAERIPDILNEKIDLVVGYSISGPPTATQRKIATTTYAICASPDYLKKFGTPQKPLDLADHHYIAHSMRKPDNILAFPDGTQVHLNAVLKINDSKALTQCALEGLGIIKVHRYIVAESLEKGTLVEILSQFKEPEIPIYLYYQESRHLQPKIRHFVDFILNSISLSSQKKRSNSVPMI